MSDRSRAFDDLANLLANAAGAVKGLGDEAKAVGRARAERLIADLDLVTRDEFEVLKARLEKQAEELAALKAGKSKPTAKKTSSRKQTASKAKPASKAAKPRSTAKKTTTRKSG